VTSTLRAVLPPGSDGFSKEVIALEVWEGASIVALGPKARPQKEI
jgi:hypothetical protein